MGSEDDLSPAEDLNDVGGLVIEGDFELEIFAGNAEDLRPASPANSVATEPSDWAPSA